jgi:hypothetical protein
MSFGDSAVHALRPAQIIRIHDQISHRCARSCPFVQLSNSQRALFRTIDRCFEQL